MHAAMDTRYPIPAATARVTTTALNSRFLATAAHTPTVESAKELIAAVRAEMPDATHHCYAFLVGYGASVIAGMSDDGEPAGTAGRPMLAVLRGADLGDVTVVVTRYFGGTLLGTGGLVRAYGGCAAACLRLADKRPWVPLLQAAFDCTFAELPRLRARLAELSATVSEDGFHAEGARLIVQAPEAATAQASAVVSDLTRGRVALTWAAG